MKKHCQENNYELLIYDIFNNKFVIEDDSFNLVEYNIFYEFVEEKKLNINKLESIFEINQKKISIKNAAKNKFIEKLNKTNLFDNIDEGKKNSLNIIGKFNYK